MMMIMMAILNLVSLRCQLAGWWFWKCVFLGHPAYNSQNFRSFNLRKQSNQVYYFHWSQYLGLGRCCWGADTLDPVGDKYIALHSCCDIQEEIPLLTWNLIPLKMSGTEPPSKGFILTSLIFRLRIWRGGHGIDENALFHHSSPQGTGRNKITHNSHHLLPRITSQPSFEKVLNSRSLANIFAPVLTEQQVVECISWTKLKQAYSQTLEFGISRFKKGSGIKQEPVPIMQKTSWTNSSSSDICKKNYATTVFEAKKLWHKRVIYNI